MNRAYPLGDWKLEIRDDNTRLGYLDWVKAQSIANSEVIAVGSTGRCVLDNGNSVRCTDSRLFRYEHPESGTQFYALVEGFTWESVGLEGTYGLINVHLTGEFRWRVNAMAGREDELEAIDYFGLSPASVPVEQLDPTPHPTLAYIITVKRKSGPLLTKSFGSFDNKATSRAHLHLYESRKEAEEALEDTLFSGRERDGWEILEVVVSSPPSTESCE